MIEQVCLLYPQIRDHVDFVDIGTPVTNSYYLAAPHGEIYGLDHTKTRMSPEVRFDFKELLYQNISIMIEYYTIYTTNY